VVALATIPLGTQVAAIAQIAALAVVLVLATAPRASARRREAQAVTS
jgi:hypothetical protein